MKSHFKTNFNRGLALLLSVLMMLTMLSTTMLTAFASDELDALLDDVDVETLTEADTKKVNQIVSLYSALDDKTSYTEEVTALQTKMTALLKEGYTRFTSYTTDFWSTQWWFEFTKGTDYDTFMSDQNGPNPDIGLAGQQMVDFDGLEIKFDNLVKMSVGNGSKPDATGIGVTFDTEIDSKYATYQKGLLLYIDADKGNLVLNKDGSSDYLELLSGSDVLKLASLEQNAFTLAINATGDDDAPYKVTIKTVDGQSVDANIPAAYFNATNVLVDGKTYVTFVCTGYDSNGAYPIGPSHVSYNIIGYRNNNEANANINFINNLLAELDVNTLTEASTKDIYKMNTLYATLNSADKSKITDIDEIAALNSKLLALRKEGYTQFSSYSNDYWSSQTWFEFTDGSDYDSFESLQNNPSYAARIGAKTPVAFDGLELKFNDFVKLAQPTTTAATGLGILFSNSEAPDFSSTKKGLVLWIDTETGSLVINSDGWANSRSLLTNEDALKLESLEHNTFTFAINATGNDDAPYKVTIKPVDGEAVSVDIPAADFSSANVLVDGKTYVTFVCTIFGVDGSRIGGSHSRYNIIGYRNCKGSEENITFVNEKLATLTPETMTEADVEDVKKIAALYSAMIPSEKAQITGSEKIPALQAKIYEVIKNGYEVYTEDHFKADSYHWASSPSNLEHHIENGLLRVTFKATGSPHPAYMGQVSEPVVFDGLEYKFNNFTINNPAAANAGVAMIFTPNYHNYLDFSDGAKAPGLLLYIDIKNGKLILNYRAYNESTAYGQGGNVTYTEILTDNAIKDLVGKIFTVKISSTNDENNPYKVSIVTSGSTPIEANIPKEYFSEKAVLVSGTNTTYVQFAMGCYGSDLTHNGHGSMDNSYDIVGYRNNKDVNWVNDKLATLPETLVETNIKDVNTVADIFAGLSDYDKALVTNSARIPELQAAILPLIKENVENLFVTENFKGYHFAPEMGLKPEMVNDILRVNFATSNVNPARVMWFKENANIDGLKLKVSNFHKNEDASKAGLGLVLSATSGTDQGLDISSVANAGLLIYLDMEAGKIIAQRLTERTLVDEENKTYKYTVDTAVLVENELLKYENLKLDNIYFTFATDFKSENPVTLTVTTGDGDVVTANVPASYIDNATVINGTKTNFAFTPGRFEFVDPEVPTAFKVESINNTFDVVGYTAEADALVGANVTLTENIDVSFKVNSETLANDPNFEGCETDENGEIKLTANFTVTGEDENDIIEMSTQDFTVDTDGNKLFTIPKIAPDYMTDEIVVVFTAQKDGETVEVSSASYSIAEYCYNMLEKSDDEDLRNVLISMLNYGTALQKHNNRRTDNLANERLSDEQKTIKTPTVENITNTKFVEIDNPTVAWKAAGLYLSDTVQLRFKVTMPKKLGMVFKVKVGENGEEVEIPSKDIKKSGSAYYVYFRGLGAHQMRENIYVTVYNGGEPVSNTLLYSVSSYVASKQTSENTALVDLVNAVMNYGDCAFNYYDKSSN